MTLAIEYGTAIIMGTSAALIQAGVILCVCMCICTCICAFRFSHHVVQVLAQTMSHNGPVKLLANRVSEKVV